MDVRVYAELMVRLWIRGGWDWNSLEITKRDNYIHIPKEITAMVRSEKKHHLLNISFQVIEMNSYNNIVSTELYKFRYSDKSFS
jgi:hypothetical protein